MKVAHGDIWNSPTSSYIVIPTNIGWNKKGRNVMGRGLAKQASLRYKDLDLLYGGKCLELKERIGITLYHTNRVGLHHLILFPVKKLNVSRPWMSWTSGASLDLIEENLLLLRQYSMSISVPLVGCGNGSLQVKSVAPLIENCLDKDNFTLYIPEGIMTTQWQDYKQSKM